MLQITRALVVVSMILIVYTHVVETVFAMLAPPFNKSNTCTPSLQRD
jgi:hypothetical protein